MLIPIIGLFLKAASVPIEDQIVRIATAARTVNALRISFGSSLIAALVNVVFGVIVAWVLVRYKFPGRRILDAIVDLPFALPTAVAGIALSTLYAPKGWIGWLVSAEWAAASRLEDRLHADRHRHRADLHRPAVRRAHGAAGARGVRGRSSKKPPQRSAPIAGRPSRG